MSTVDKTVTETKAPASAPDTSTHHHGGIIGKVEDVFHSISQKLHVKHDKPLHPESEKEHRDRTGSIGERQELGTNHPEAEQGYGAGGAWEDPAQALLGSEGHLALSDV